MKEEIKSDKKYHTIETYIEATKNVVKAEEQNNNKSKCYNNLPEGGRENSTKRIGRHFGNNWRKNKIITKIDKGGAVAIIDFEDYVKDAEHQLNNEDPYRKLRRLQHDSTQTHTIYVEGTVIHIRNDKLISKNIVEQRETLIYYTRLKIHKQEILEAQ